MAKDFPAAKALCNSNSEFDHESQTFEHSEPELNALNETALGSTNIQWLANAYDYNSKGCIANSNYCGALMGIIEQSTIADGICRFQQRRAKSNHLQ